jgi:hypothetical protein
MGKKKFNLQHYEVQFERVLEVPEAKELLHKFLQKNLTEESLLFTLDVNAFKAERDTKKQAEKLLSIVNEYLVRDSERELNMEDKEREYINNVITESKQREKLDSLVAPATIFDRLYPKILNEMKQDAFARFIRSAQFTKFAYEKGEEFVKQIAIHQSLLDIQDILITPKDFESGTITDKDVKFVLSLQDDGMGWVSVRPTKEGELERHQYSYVSNAIFRQEGESGKCIIAKHTGNLPISAREMAMIVGNPLADPVLEPKIKINILKVVKAENNDNKYTCQITHNLFPIAPLMKMRESTVVKTLLHDTERRCYIRIAKSTVAYRDEYKPNKRRVQAEIYSSWIFYEVSENKCRYVCPSWADVHMHDIFNSEKFAIKFNQSRGVAVHEMFLKAIARKDEFLSETAGEMECLNDFKQRFLPDQNAVMTWTL